MVAPKNPFLEKTHRTSLKRKGDFMLCEKCNLQEATVHLQQTINGETKDIYLCADCAGDGEFGISFENLFQGFLESFFGAKPSFAYGKKAQIPEQTTNRCAVCGLTYENLKKTSKLGCAECYVTFKNELNYIIKNIQGSNTHEGKFPKRGGQEFIQKREVEILKAKLKKAVEDEEYEVAARIRDEIKERSASDGKMV
jgi:protein arginine kinase activator